MSYSKYFKNASFLGRKLMLCFLLIVVFMGLKTASDPTPYHLEECSEVHKLSKNQGFQYYFHFPQDALERENVPFVVIVHGLSRNSASLFSLAVERHPDWIILAPYFPRQINALSSCDESELSYDGNDYRHLILRLNASDENSAQSVRYDLILLDMVNRAWNSLGLGDYEGKFSLLGYSAGAQFAHRFAYVHPERLYSLAIGAPGTITPWDEEQLYPKGVKNLQETMGTTSDIDTLKNVPVLFFVGSNDLGEIDAHVESSVYNALDTDLQAEPTNRVELIHKLYHNWLNYNLGKNVSLKILDDLGHDSYNCMSCALDFAEEVYS